MSNENSKCPVTGNVGKPSSARGTSNQDWWSADYRHYNDFLPVALPSITLYDRQESWDTIIIP